MKNDKDKQLMELLRHDSWLTKPVGDDPLVASVDTAQQAQPAICPTCNGKGWYMVGPTLFPEQVQCEDCYGTGKQQA